MGTLHIIGLGPGDMEDLTLGVYRLILKQKKIYARTMKHPIINQLSQEDILIESFDWLYENSQTFEEVYSNIVNYLIEKAKKEDVVYAVPGHPLFAEKTVEILIKMLDNIRDEINIQIYSSVSFLDVIMTSMRKDPVDGLELLNAVSIKNKIINTELDIIITQVYDRFTASEVKLQLLQNYPADKMIYVLHWCGIKGKEKIINIPLYQLDHLSEIDHLTTVYIPSENDLNKRNISGLIGIMKKLRSPEGCPWDREQNEQSLKRYLIEETYEVINAIDTGDYENLAEELGDLLLQIVFLSEIASEKGYFEFDDVVERIIDKLIYRHPHVFGDGSDYHEDKWEELKRKEKELEYQWQAMSSVPKSLPTLYLAEKIQKKAKNVGFDWDKPGKAIDKIIEESNELKAALNNGSKHDIMHELGDVLFSIVNVSRMLDIDPDEALHNTIDKFISRFRYIEESLIKRGSTLNESSLETMEKLWQESKKHLR